MLGKDRNREAPESGAMNTIIGKGSVLEGTFHIENSIRVDGVLRGELTSTNTVVVGPTGQIEANIKAQNAVIAGRVVGDLDIAHKTRLESRAVVLGDLKTRVLIVEEGTVFRGNCESGDDAQIPPVEPHRSNPQ